jgi:hypothetical protein
MDIIRPNLLYLSISKPNVRLSPGRNYGFLGRFNVSINTEDMSTSASAILDIRTVSGNPNLNDIRKNVAEALTDQWFELFKEAAELLKVSNELS